MISQGVVCIRLTYGIRYDTRDDFEQFPLGFTRAKTPDSSVSNLTDI
jgi:hypothetical protein